MNGRKFYFKFIFEDSKFKIIPSTEDTNLFKLDETEKLINDTNPDILINAADKSWRYSYLTMSKELNS